MTGEQEHKASFCSLAAAVWGELPCDNRRADMRGEAVKAEASELTMFSVWNNPVMICYLTVSLTRSSTTALVYSLESKLFAAAHSKGAQKLGWDGTREQFGSRPNSIFAWEPNSGCGFLRKTFLFCWSMSLLISAHQFFMETVKVCSTGTRKPLKKHNLAFCRDGQTCAASVNWSCLGASLTSFLSVCVCVYSYCLSSSNGYEW